MFSSVCPHCSPCLFSMSTCFVYLRIVQLFAHMWYIDIINVTYNYIIVIVVFFFSFSLIVFVNMLNWSSFAPYSWLGILKNVIFMKLNIYSSAHPIIYATYANFSCFSEGCLTHQRECVQERFDFSVSLRAWLMTIPLIHTGQQNIKKLVVFIGHLPNDMLYFVTWAIMTRFVVWVTLSPHRHVPDVFKLGSKIRQNLLQTYTVKFVNFQFLNT